MKPVRQIVTKISAAFTTFAAAAIVAELTGITDLL